METKTDIKMVPLTTQYIAILAGVLVVVIGVSFFSGMRYGQKKMSANAFRQNGSGQFHNSNGSLNGNRIYSGAGGTMMGQQGMGMRAGGNGVVSGSVINKDEKSLTLKLMDGSSKIIFFSESVPVSKSVQGSVADIVNGTQVFVNGKANSDGSVVADSIQIRPEQQQQGAK